MGFDLEFLKKNSYKNSLVTLGTMNKAAVPEDAETYCGLPGEGGWRWVGFKRGVLGLERMEIFS